MNDVPKGLLVPWRPKFLQGAAEPTFLNLDSSYQIVGEYCMGEAFVEFTSAGSSNNPVLMQLPVPVKQKSFVVTGNSYANAQIVGYGRFVDNGSSTWGVYLCVSATTNTMTFTGTTNPKGAGGWCFFDVWPSVAPVGNGGGAFTMAIAAGDWISVQFMYRLSPSAGRTS